MVHRTARKALLVTALAFGLVIVLAAPAYAGGWVSWSDVATLPGNAGSTSPHGGYTTASVKCKVCHAVHNATALGSELLLPSTVADACNYCHVGGAGGYTQVYAGDPNNYSGTDYKNAHNWYESSPGNWTGVTCGKCHQVHAAAQQMTANSALTVKLLKNFTFWDFTAGAPLSSDDTQTAMTKWCAGCHFTLSTPPLGGEHYAVDFNLGSHIMTTTETNYSNPSATYTGQVAWKDSTYCQSCHASDYGTAAWPHYTQGVQFLVEATSSVDATMPASNASQDGVCLRCHRDGSGAGAGLGF